MEIKIVSILGCGWFGLAFAKALIEKGYTVKGSTTSVEKLEKLKELGVKPYLIDLNEDKGLSSDFFETDVLFISVPPRAKTEDASQYPAKIKRVIAAAKGKAKQFVLISSTGVFEDGNFEVDENAVPKPETAASKALFDAEQAFGGLNVTIIRFAGLIGTDRNLGKFFAGRTDIPNGNAPINLIALEDCIGLCLQLLAMQKFGGVYHGVSPHHPTREGFYTKLCEASGMEKASFKNELLEWKQINSVNIPNKLGYVFKVQNWFDWMGSTSF